MQKEKFKYPIEVFWSEEDEGYIATVPDLAGCSAWGATEEDVVHEIHDAAKAWIKAETKAGRTAPLAVFIDLPLKCVPMCTQ